MELRSDSGPKFCTLCTAAFPL